ncbi:MAG TPA: 2-phosphosulfolactate phosphatase [Pseudonocardiaceae bacterium]|nr:2-phosphosulfolactate phosphatase [Pseudonocardiaceae bacterium]
MDATGVFGQHDSRVRLEWGAHGVDVLAGFCAVVVVVDVLSFTTSVDIALGRGARIQPLPWRDEPAAAAAKAGGAVLAGEQKWTLRPASLLDIPAGTLLAVPSPNGATLCTRVAGRGAVVLAGCLRNAAAVAGLAADLADGGPIGVLPGGERWWVDGFPLRPCVEDQLGAGAIVAALDDLGVRPASPEAALAAAGYRATADVPGTIAACVSGRELIDIGHGAGVGLATEIGVSSVTPRLVDGVLLDASARLSA